MTRLDRIRDVLCGGPSTASEIAATLSITTRPVTRALWGLHDRREVERIGKIPTRGKPHTLYAIKGNHETTQRVRRDN